MTFWDLVLIWFAPIAISIGVVYFYTKRKRDPSADEEPHPEILSMIAHQLRSPIDSIRGLSQRLAASRLEPDQRDRILDIQKINQHLVDVIENLKKLGKDKLSGEAENGREYFLANLVNEITGLFKFPAERKNVRIVLGVHPGVGKITTDKFLLTEAVKNILENAVNHSTAGSTIDISVRQDGGRYAIAISNDREGISEKNGGGLGLLIAETAIRANRGELEIKSPSGQGVLFIISLPVK